MFTRTNIRSIKSLLLAMVFITLTACGGGGSGSAAAPAGSVPLTSTALQVLQGLLDVITEVLETTTEPLGADAIASFQALFDNVVISLTGNGTDNVVTTAQIQEAQEALDLYVLETVGGESPLTTEQILAAQDALDSAEEESRS